MRVMLVLLVFSIGYMSTFFIANSKRLHDLLRSRFGEKRTSLIWALVQRGVGFFCLGFLPGVVFLSLSGSRFSDIGFTFHYSLSSFLLTLAVGVCVVVISFLFSRKPENFQRYPQVRLTHWTLRVVLLNAGSWMAYLLAYEALFRGIVFFSLLDTLGIWLAVLITTSLYIIVHIPKGIKETLGAAPFGILLCLITWEAGTIWPAFFLHVILALSFDHFSLCANPDMGYFFKRSKGL